MKQLKFLVQVALGVGLIVAGCEYLPRLFFKPDAPVNWIGAIMIAAGIFVAARVCYVERRGGLLAGIPLLLFAGIYVWNLHYYFDPTRVRGGAGPPASFFVAPVLLTLLGVFFSVFFRYLYPTATVTLTIPAAPESGAKGPPRQLVPEVAPGVSRGEMKALSCETTRPWVRLGMLAASTILGVVVGMLPGIRDSDRRFELIFTVMLLGCVATGLISEKTLVELLPWKSKSG